MRDNNDGLRAAARFDIGFRPDFGARAPFMEVSGLHRFDGSFNSSQFGHRSLGHATFEMDSQFGNRCLPTMQITDQRYNSWGRRNPYMCDAGYDRGFDRRHAGPNVYGRGTFDGGLYGPNMYGRGTFYGGICRPSMYDQNYEMRPQDFCGTRPGYRGNDSWQRHRTSLNSFFDGRQPERYHEIPRLQDRPWRDDRSQCTFGSGDRYAQASFSVPFGGSGIDMQITAGPRDMTYHSMRGMRGNGRSPYPVPEVHPTFRTMQPRQEAPQYYAPQNQTMRRISYTPDAVPTQPERPQQVAYQPEESVRNGASSKLNSNDFVDRVIQNISAHEGNFNSINKNDAGYGISIGIRQWNQKAGELPVLLKAWNRQDPQKFNQIFGPYAEQLLNDKWVRSYDMANDAQFMSRMKTALADKEFQDVQVSESRAFVKRNMELANSYGFKSELGVALICDMVNHMGTGGTEKALKKVGLVKGGQIADERRAVERLSSVRPNGQMYYAMLDKKFSSDASANQNSPYNPNQRSNSNIAYA